MQPLFQIAGADPRIRGSQNVSLAEQGGEVAGLGLLAALQRTKHHVGQARMQGQLGQAGSHRGDPTAAVDGIQL